MSLKSQSFAFSLLFAALVTLSCFPVLGWHYWTTLNGLAVLAIGGLLLSDCVMWFSAFWSVRADAPLMRVTALVVKYSIGLAAVLVAACVLVLMRAEHQSDAAAAKETAARVAEIQARTQAAKELSAVNRAAAKEAMKLANPTQVSSRTVSVLPSWLAEIGVYCLLPLLSILGAVALSVSASIAAHTPEAASVRVAEITPRPSSSIVELATISTSSKSAKRSKK